LRRLGLACAVLDIKKEMLASSLLAPIRVQGPSVVRRQFSSPTSLNLTNWRPSHQKCWTSIRPTIRSFTTSTKTLNRALGDAAKRQKRDNLSAVMYATSAGIVMIGVAYASVPLYKVFCQATGLGGEVKRGHDAAQVVHMRKVEDTILEIRFNADTHSSMMWNFKPQQPVVTVRPGETALAFYKAKNPLSVPVIGISTYNVVPFEVAPYFNKIQCFCFEEQRLNPGEEVDLPVFFYIDPEFCEDPLLDGVTTITLSYTFFEAKEGFQVPLPGYN